MTETLPPKLITQIETDLGFSLKEVFKSSLDNKVIPINTLNNILEKVYNAGLDGNESDLYEEGYYDGLHSVDCDDCDEFDSGWKEGFEAGYSDGFRDGKLDHDETNEHED